MVGRGVRLLRVYGCMGEGYCELLRNDDRWVEGMGKGKAKKDGKRKIGGELS